MLVLPHRSASIAARSAGSEERLLVGDITTRTVRRPLTCCLWPKGRILMVIDNMAGFASQEDRLMLREITDQRADRAHDFQPREDDPASLVAARLRRSGYPYLRGVKCEVREGVAVLSGTVPTFYLKQMAQALASHTPGVQQIENRLHVTSSMYRAACSTAVG